MRGKVLVLMNCDFRSPYPFLWHGRLRLLNKNSHAARSARAVPAPAHLSERESPWTSTCEAAVVWSLGQTMVSKWYIWGGCNSGRVCIILISMVNSLYVKFFLLTIWIPKPASKPSPSVLFCLACLNTVWIYEQGISSAGLNQEHWKVDFLSRGTCVGIGNTTSMLVDVVMPPSSVYIYSPFLFTITARKLSGCCLAANIGSAQ